ncbi:VOC family protein [Nonomuraea sp. NPDC048826]|uniref:VOC family protein n=1 Tax=Nonomuraea sp. NPDC048826 TaxID=3364347 RepID=UPI0037204E97
MPQPVVHFEIVGGDAAALHTFYAQLFGWKVEPSGPGGYGLVQPSGPDGITGGIGSGDSGDSRHVTIYVEVPDVGTALDRAEELGGRRLFGPDIVPGTNVELGQFTDPEDHVIGLTAAITPDQPHARRTS